MQEKELRPKCVLRNAALQEVNTTDATRTTAGYQKTGDLLTLPYTEEVISEQPFATTIERVTPYLISSWIGRVTLDPDQDSWFETEIAPQLVINREGNFDAVVAANRNQLGVVWNAWQDTWSGRITQGPLIWWGDSGDGDFGAAAIFRQTESGSSRRTGTRTTVEVDIQRESQGFRSIGRTAIPIVRARNIRFDATGLKPFQRMYVFFDGRSVSQYVTPDANSTSDATPVAGSPLIVRGNSQCGGTFQIPDPKVSGNPQFRTGDVVFALTSDLANGKFPESFAQTTYSANGILDTQQETIIATRNARLSQENLTLLYQQLLQFFHQQHPRLQLELQLVELTELQPLHQLHQLIHLPHPHQAVDLAIAADINDRHINTKSRNQSGN